MAVTREPLSCRCGAKLSSGLRRLWSASRPARMKRPSAASGLRAAPRDADLGRAQHALADQIAGLDHLRDRAIGHALVGDLEQRLVLIGIEALALRLDLLDAEAREAREEVALGELDALDQRDDALVERLRAPAAARCRRRGADYRRRSASRARNWRRHRPWRRRPPSPCAAAGSPYRRACAAACPSSSPPRPGESPSSAKGSGSPCSESA